jgi:hypothetical protein
MAKDDYQARIAQAIFRSIQRFQNRIEEPTQPEASGQ